MVAIIFCDGDDCDMVRMTRMESMNGRHIIHECPKCGKVVRE